MKPKLLYALVLLVFALNARAQEISGRIIDEADAELAAVTIVEEGGSKGITTDANGRYLMKVSKIPTRLILTFIGYETKILDVTHEGEQETVRLKQSIETLSEVVVSASRKPEKVTESTASISVLSSKQLSVMGTQGESLELLKNLPGVRLVDNGVAKVNVTLRGQALTNETLTLVLKDYRSISNPHTTIIDNERMGVNALDIDRIEVVRGPSGAMWGPGVNAGVVHFITKDPFKFPGTGVSISRSVEGQGINKFDFRHAASTEKFGYKIVYSHRDGNDFVYDLQNQDDIKSSKSLINASGAPSLRDGIIQGVTGGPSIRLPKQLDANGDSTYNLIPEFHSNTIEAQLEYRPAKNFKIVLAPQYGESEINFRNSGGHTRDWGNIVNVQTRINYKDFFVSLNYFEAFEWNGKNGPTNYGNRSTAYITTGTDNRGNVQVYDFASQLPFSGGERLDFVTGFDAKMLRFRGSPKDIPALKSRSGRFDNDDDFDVFGGYFQASYKVNPDLKINAVGRADMFSIYGSSISPRVGVVYNPGGDKSKSFRFGLSKSYRAPSPIVSNFDYALAGQNVLGARQEQTFDKTYIKYGALGLDPTNASPSLTAVLKSILPVLSDADSTALAGTVLAGNATSTFNDPLTGVQFANISDQYIRKAKLESTTAIELGYTGGNDRLRYTLDGFYQVQENMLVNFAPVGPQVRFNNLTTELTNALTSAGTDPALAAKAVTAATAAYKNPFNAMSDQQQVSTTGAMANPFPSSGFRSFDGKAKYFGVEASVEYTLDHGITPFANLSWLSDTAFDTKELKDDPQSGRIYYLNTAPFRTRFGVTKQAGDKGFFGSLAGRYDAAFDGQDGVWNGHVPSYFLVDIGAGYKMSNGLKIGANATNLTDVLYRSLPNMPAQRRLIFITLSYQLDHNLLKKK